MRTALITGVAGRTLAPREAAFLKEARPAGLILFARNLESHAQIRALVDAVCEAVGSHELLVLIDQEGGRVQRLRPPLGPQAAAGSRLRARLQARPRRRRGGRFRGRAAARGRSESAGHQHELRAGRRPACARIARDHRRPRLRHRFRAGDSARQGGCRRLHGRRRRPRHQAHPRSRAGDRGQPSRASRRDGEPR